METNNSLPEGFQLDAQTQAAPMDVASSDSSSPPEGFQLDSEKYGTLKQQGITALEGLAQGVGGPLVPLAEKGLGLNPEELRLRAEENPWVSGISQGLGFVGSLASGIGEGAIVAKAGQAAAKGLGLGLEGASTASKIAAGATKVATEMAMLQASDEVTKYITNDPEAGVQSAIPNILLSSVIGGVAGGALKGLGLGVGAAMERTGLKDGVGLKEFTDRLAYRGSGVATNEIMGKELEDAVKSYYEMGHEVTGPNGMKAMALEKILPKEMTSEILSQIEEISTKSKIALEQMSKDQVPDRLIKKYLNELNNFEKNISDSSINPSKAFDEIQDFKTTLADFAGGKWGEDSVPSYHEAYDFLKSTKNLGHDIRVGLESPKAWGEAGNLQKGINSSWVLLNKDIKDVTAKFMTRIRGIPEIDLKKFTGYLNENGKMTSASTRQKMVGNFVESYDKYQKEVDNLYKKAGIPNPHSPIGLGAMKESLEKVSPWAKAADLWYDKMVSKVLGGSVGTSAGAALGAGVPIPGSSIAMAFFGREIGEKLLPSIIQPMLEKATSYPGFQSAMKFLQSSVKGDSKILETSRNIFSGSKTIPQHLMPDHDSTEKLDAKLQELQKNPSKLFSMAEDPLGHYMPGHAQALALTTQRAVSYLNSMRPQVPKVSPLDEDIKPSKAQEAFYQRTLQIAEQPLMVLKHVKDGTIIPDDIKTLNVLYPKLYDQMSGHIMTALTDHLKDGGHIPYTLRQSLSIFLAKPLDSTMLPSSIASVQLMYAGKQAQRQQQNQPGPAPHSTSKLNKVAQGAMTGNQAREARAHKTS